MAKPRIIKLKTGFNHWELKDLLCYNKIENGGKVIFAIKRRKGRYKLVKVMVYAKSFTFCECCGPEVFIKLTKVDGTVVFKSW